MEEIKLNKGNNEENKNILSIVSVIIFLITAIVFTLFFLPGEKESVILSLDERWNIGFEMEYDEYNNIPLIEFDYNGIVYSTFPNNNKVGTLPKFPHKVLLENIINVSASDSVTSYQNMYTTQNHAFAVYAVEVNGEIYYTREKIFPEQVFYDMTSELIDQNMLKVTFNPSWFWFVVGNSIVSLVIAFVCTVSASLVLLVKQKKGQ